MVLDGGLIFDVPPASPAPAGELLIDGEGGILAPGFIDLHIHGLHEYLIDRSPENLSAVARLLPQYGVTGFLPTVCPRPKGEDASFVASLADTTCRGASMLGIHLEGPFLTHTGALPPEALGQADPERVRALRNACEPYGAVFSIAPDFEDICELIPIMAEGDRPVFITHTSADVRQTRAAIEAGARHATHFYDVFYPSPETEPGVRPCGAVEAILADPRCSVDFILDGEHVDPVAVEMALQCKGPDRVCLVTDANVGAGLPPGTHRFLDYDVTFAYPGGPARRVEDGGLAGSGLTLDRAVRNALEFLPIQLPQALRLVGENPARVLGLHDRKGRIQPGYDADLVLLDRDLRVRKTWVAGKCVYETKKRNEK